MLNLLFRELSQIFESLIRFIPSATGRIIRKIYYSNKFKTCGKNLVIDVGVEFIGCKYISCGDNVWFGAYSNRSR